MNNAEVITALQCASHFALYQDCYEKNCHANSGKGLYCNIPKLMADAADALEAAEKRIAELEAKMPKEGEWIIKPHGTYGQLRAFCSACGKHSGIGGIVSNQKKPYCPICGARMRKGEQE